MIDLQSGQKQASGQSVDLVMLSTKEAEDYAWLGIQSWGNYCARHGYSFHVVREQLVPDMHPVWSKIEMMRRRLRETDASHVVLVDADSVVYNPNRSLANLLAAGKPLNFASDDAVLGIGRWFRQLFLKLKTQRFVLPNAGFILVENSLYTQAFFDEWMSLACGELAGLADTHPRNQNVLWHGMLRHHSPNIATVGSSVARITHSNQLFLLRLYNPLAVHFKHEIISTEKIEIFLNSRSMTGSGE